jgi:hypothetical protein
MGPRRTLVLVVVMLVASACASGGGNDAESADSTADAIPAETPPPTSTPTAPSTTTPTATPTSSPTPIPTPEPEPEPLLSTATLNLLHGLFCPPETDWCDAPTRLEILWAHIEAADCPDVVALQEVGPRQFELIPERLEALCDGAYTPVFEDMGWPDQEVILTALPITDDGFEDLAGFPWSAHWAVLEAESGPILYLATHLASEANNPVCTAEFCPAEMCPEGITAGSCNAHQVIEIIDQRASGTIAQFVVGDLNKPIDHPRMQIFTDAGFSDAWTVAGNAECDPATGAGCTCCIDGPEPWGGLDLADQTMGSRIDFVLFRGGADCASSLAVGDAAAFAAAPLEEPLEGLYWASDHGGVSATFVC